MIFMTASMAFITNACVVHIPPGDVQHYSKQFVVPSGDEIFSLSTITCIAFLQVEMYMDVDD